MGSFTAQWLPVVGLFFSVKKLTSSDPYLKVSVFSFFIFKSGQFISFRVIIIVGKTLSGIYSFDMQDPALKLCLQDIEAPFKATLLL